MYRQSPNVLKTYYIRIYIKMSIYDMMKDLVYYFNCKGSHGFLFIMHGFRQAI